MFDRFKFGRPGPTLAPISKSFDGKIVIGAEDRRSSERIPDTVGEQLHTRYTVGFPTTPHCSAYPSSVLWRLLVYSEQDHTAPRDERRSPWWDRNRPTPKRSDALWELSTEPFWGVASSDPKGIKKKIKNKKSHFSYTRTILSGWGASCSKRLKKKK